MATGLDSFSLLAIPFFILAGQLMNQGGIANRLINFARSLVGVLPGGLIYVNIIGLVCFSEHIRKCGRGSFCYRWFYDTKNGKGRVSKTI